MKLGGIANIFKGISQRMGHLVTPKKPIIAVDLGSNSIKIAKVKKSGIPATLELIYYRQLNIQNIPTDEMERRDFWAREVRNAASILRLKNPLVATGVAGSSVIVREAKLPALPPAELNRTLAFEAEPFIPYDIREVNLDYHIIGEVTEEGQPKYEVILVAAKKDLLEGHLAILVAAGLKPIVIDVNAFTLVNLLDNIPQTKDETVVVANIGASVTNLAIVEKGSPRVVRDVAVAGNAFTKALQNAVNLDDAACEKLKREVGLIIADSEKEGLTAAGETQKLQVSNTLAGVASDLLNEIHRSTDFYLAHGQERTIHRLYLTGGGALLKNLAPFASTQLKIPTEILNPLQVLKAPNLMGVPQEMGPAFSIACGLALRSWNDWTTKK